MGKASVESLIRISVPDSDEKPVRTLLNLSNARLVKQKRGAGNEGYRLIIEGKVGPQESVVAHVESLCEELDRLGNSIDFLPSESETDIWCTIYSESEFVGFCIESDLLRRLADLKVNLVFSYYERSDTK